MEVTQGVGVMSDVAVSVSVLCAELRRQQLAVSHQGRGASPASTQVLQVVDGLMGHTGQQGLIFLLSL